MAIQMNTDSTLNNQKYALWLLLTVVVLFIFYLCSKLIFKIYFKVRIHFVSTLLQRFYIIAWSKRAMAKGSI